MSVFRPLIPLVTWNSTLALPYSLIGVVNKGIRGVEGAPLVTKGIRELYVNQRKQDHYFPEVSSKSLSEIHFDHF